MALSDWFAGKTLKLTPGDAPITVDLRTETLRPNKHRLHIDVSMSDNDWKIIKSANLVSYQLFSYPKVTPLDDCYLVGHLLRVRHVDFDDLIALNSAKNSFLQNLRALRSHLETLKDPDRDSSERHEI